MPRVIPLLLLAWLFRLIPSLNSLFLIRADEVQFWEMAHRLIFGDGCIAWEYRVGARSLLYFLPIAVPLFLCTLIGLDQPQYYIPAVKGFLSFASLIVPLGMWRILIYFKQEHASWIALFLGCFWFEFVISASHGLTEFYTVYFCFAALALWREKMRGPSAFWVGVFLGLAMLFRPHNVLVLSVLSGFLFLKANSFIRAWMVGGGALATFLGFSIDAIIYGRFAHSFILYGNSIFAAAQLQGLNPRWQQLMNLTICSGGIFPVVIGYGILNYRKHFFFLAIILSGLVFFSIQGAQEYSYIAVIIPFILCLSACLWSEISDRWLKIVLLGYVFFINGLGLAGRIPPLFIFEDNWKLNVRPNGIFYRDPILDTALELSRMPSGSVIWSFGDAVASGGYYVFHHHRQIFFPGGVPAHAELLQNRDPRTFARYIVLPESSGSLEGFRLLKINQGLAIYENMVLPANQELEGYHYELQLPMDAPTIQLLLRKGLISSEPPLTSWKK